MTVIKYSLPAVFLVITALSASEAIEFPGLPFASDCIETKCGVRMRSCLRTNQWKFTDNAKGCIARDCKNSLTLCVKEIPEMAMAYAKAFAGIAEQYVDYGLEVFSDSYLQCWLDTDIDNGTQVIDCVVDGLLKKTEPFVTLFGSKLFSDPVYMACWTVHSGKVLFSSLLDIHMDTNYKSQMEKNKEKEIQRNFYEYFKCVGMNKFDGDCAAVWNRILGTPPAMRRQTKDYFLGILHKLITVTVKCRRS